MIVFVTGASAGIGLATAERFAAAGARVLVNARRADLLNRLVDRLDEQHGEGTARALVADVAQPRFLEAAFRDLPPAWQDVDVIVNNAGLARGLKPVWENTPDEVNDMVDTNVKGVLNALRLVVPGMLERGRGHVVNVGSTAGHFVYPGGTVYCATKHAVGALGLGLKMDLHGTPVRVTTVSPGLVETDFSLVRFDGDADRADAVYADTNALTAEDIADAVVYAVQTPPHVNVQEILVTPRVQSATLIARGEEAQGL